MRAARDVRAYLLIRNNWQTYDATAGEFEKADTLPFAARIAITTVIIKASYRYRRA